VLAGIAPGMGERLRMYSCPMLPYEIEPRDLENLKQDTGEPRFLLLDVREPWEYEIARLDGSVNMPMGDVPSRANAELDPDQRIIAICHHGVRSLSVASWLRNQGFEQAQSLAGGIDSWAAQLDPAMPRY
jgi:rhodanese-related sulfurtransferase